LIKNGGGELILAPEMEKLKERNENL